MQKIIIAIPAYNEEKYIEACLNSVLEFYIPKYVQHEIWVWDGGSTDNTVKIVKNIMEKFPVIQLFHNPMKTQAHAMNLTIKRSKPDWIMRLDAHSIYPSNYLIELYNTAIETNAGNVGGVWDIQKRGQGLFDLLAHGLITHRFGIGNSQFRSGIKPGPVDTVPFGFFNYETFDVVGAFNEKLVRAQDYEFNCRLIQKGYQIWLNPNVIVKYLPKNNLSQLIKKYFSLEAPYNAYMWYLAPYTFSLRHSITICFTLGIIMGGILSLISPIIFKVYLGILILYMSLSIGAAIHLAWLHKKLSLVIFMPLTFFIFHFGHGLGVLKGITLLLLKKAPVQKD